jgi:hypothetical protein
MKKETLETKIKASLYTKKGTLADRFSFLPDFLVAGKWHGKNWRGTGRYLSLSDTQYRAAIEICEKLGLDYTLGNDAPMGGKNGDFVALTEKGKRQVAPWVKVEVARRAEAARAEAEAKAAKKAEEERKIADFLEVLNENKETVAEVLGEPLAWMSKRQYGGRIHHLALRLHLVNCNEFYVAANKFFNFD